MSTDRELIIKNFIKNLNEIKETGLHLENNCVITAKLMKISEKINKKEFIKECLLNFDYNSLSSAEQHQFQATNIDTRQSTLKREDLGDFANCYQSEGPSEFKLSIYVKPYKLININDILNKIKLFRNDKNPNSFSANISYSPTDLYYAFGDKDKFMVELSRLKEIFHLYNKEEITIEESIFTKEVNNIITLSKVREYIDINTAKEEEILDYLKNNVSEKAQYLWEKRLEFLVKKSHYNKTFKTNLVINVSIKKGN